MDLLKSARRIVRVTREADDGEAFVHHHPGRRRAKRVDDGDDAELLGAAFVAAATSAEAASEMALPDPAEEEMFTFVVDWVDDAALLRARRGRLHASFPERRGGP